MQSILLEQNGKTSSGKRTKHIAICYFFVTDRIRAGEISPKWCPTGEMIYRNCDVLPLLKFCTNKPILASLLRQFFLGGVKGGVLPKKRV